MVVREREVHDRPDRDHVLAEFVLNDPRTLHDRVGAEDRGLWLADDRRPVERAVAARIRDRERPAGDVVRCELLLACAFRDVGDRARDAKQIQPFAIPSRLSVSAFFRTGTIRPFPSASSTAKPRLTNFFVTIWSPRISPFTHG